MPSRTDSGMPGKSAVGGSTEELGYGYGDGTQMSGNTSAQSGIPQFTNPATSAPKIGGLGTASEQATQNALSGYGRGTEDRRQQQAYIDALYGKLGSRTSDAATMLGQAQDRNAQNLASALAARRGLNSGSATRMALWQNGQANQQTAQQAQAAKIQEDAINRQLLAQALNAKRAQDLAQQGADTSLLGTGGSLFTQQRGQDIAGNEFAQSGTASNYWAQQQLQAAKDAADRQMIASIIGAVGSAGTSLVTGGLGHAPSNPVPTGGTGWTPNVGNYYSQLSSPVPQFADGGEVPPSRDNPTDFALDMNLPPRLIREAMARALMHARSGAESDITGGARDAYEHEMRPQQHEGDMAYANGGMTTVPPMVDGGHVPGRAKVKGDNQRNDTVLTRLSPGEGVIPRSIMKSPNAPSLAASFVEEMKQSHAKSGTTEKKGAGDHAPLLARASKIKQHLKKINALLEAK